MVIGIIGAGTMGSGIAQAFASNENYSVKLTDINDEFAAGRLHVCYQYIFTFYNRDRCRA